MWVLKFPWIALLNTCSNKRENLPILLVAWQQMNKIMVPRTFSPRKRKIFLDWKKESKNLCNINTNKDLNQFSYKNTLNTVESTCIICFNPHIFKKFSYAEYITCFSLKTLLNSLPKLLIRDFWGAKGWIVPLNVINKCIYREECACITWNKTMIFISL